MYKNVVLGCFRILSIEEFLPKLYSLLISMITGLMLETHDINENFVQSPFVLASRDKLRRIFMAWLL